MLVFHWLISISCLLLVILDVSVHLSMFFLHTNYSYLYLFFHWQFTLSFSSWRLSLPSFITSCQRFINVLLFFKLSFSHYKIEYLLSMVSSCYIIPASNPSFLFIFYKYLFKILQLWLEISWLITFSLSKLSYLYI